MRNDYEVAINSVGYILAKYDSDQEFPVWGFGSQFNGDILHFFQCGTEKEAIGVKGIIDAYRKPFQKPLIMSYPTVFTEVIGAAANYAMSRLVRFN